MGHMDVLKTRDGIQYILQVLMDITRQNAKDAVRKQLESLDKAWEENIVEHLSRQNSVKKDIAKGDVIAAHRKHLEALEAWEENTTKYLDMHISFDRDDWKNEMDGLRSLQECLIPMDI